MNHFESSVINLIWTKKLVLLYNYQTYMESSGSYFCDRKKQKCHKMSFLTIRWAPIRKHMVSSRAVALKTNCISSFFFSCTNTTTTSQKLWKRWSLPPAQCCAETRWRTGQPRRPTSSRCLCSQTFFFVAEGVAKNAKALVPEKFHWSYVSICE